MTILTRRFGDRRWDLWLRLVGALALLGIPVAIYIPEAVPLVWFALAAVPANGPLSPVLPALFEPQVMEAAKHASPLAVTCVGVSIYMLMEYLNYHLYGWVLDRERFTAMREKRWVARSVAAFARFPAATVFVFALLPLPFWVVRILSILHGFSIRRFMIVTALGRFPRILFYAWVGAAIAVPTWALVALVVAVTLGLLALQRAAHDRPAPCSAACTDSAEQPPNDPAR